MTFLFEDVPNKHHLERIVAHAQANQAAWGVLYDEKSSDAYDTAFSIITEEYGQRRGVNMLSDISNLIIPYSLVRLNCVAALIAYPDCGHMLDSDPEELEIIAKLGSCPAELLLNACRILHGLEIIEPEPENEFQ